MNEELLAKALPYWTDLLTERERQTVDLANVYTDHYQGAGIAGHNQLILISKLAEMLNRVSEKTGIVITELYRPEG